jgi:subtilisin family serine protease
MNLQLTLAVLAAVTFASANAAPVLVHQSVHRKLQQTNKVDIVVTMKTKPNESLKDLESISFATRGQKIETMVNQLDLLATESQKEIEAVLAKEATSGQPLFDKHHRSWTLNARLINGASLELVEKLAALPGVESIREQLVGRIIKPESHPVNFEEQPQEIQWGIDRIGATKVWADGTNGQNIVVGSLDTGVRGSHEILKNSMRESYNWYDPVNKTAFPHDMDGHGTHTMGTMVGSNGYGVAPGAKWMSCLGCPSDCPEFNLVKCGEFLTCPTDTQGNNKDCSKAPHVINNSWGFFEGNVNAFHPVVNAWRAAGIIPVFSIGNLGPNCSSAASPGDFSSVIGVGAMSKNETLVWYSGRGPAVGTGILKPDISAPGLHVRSGWNGSDTDYDTISGTSMAAPHITGTIALMLSAEPNLKYDQVYARLTATTDQSNFASSLSTDPGPGATDTCGSIKETVFPNYQYGYGRVNAFGAYKGQRTAATSTTPASLL